jgi:two-component system, LuxR family, response regulator FixJ
MSDPAIIYIVDDDEAVRDSLSLLIESAGYRARSFESAEAFLGERSLAELSCALIDVRMPGMDGVALQEHLATRSNHPPVIIMTGHGDVPIAVRAMKAGAIDFLEKPFEDDVLLESLRRALDVARDVRLRQSGAAEAAARIGRLSEREREVLQGLVAGHPNKTIAYDLGISPRTVEIHRARVMEKLEANSLPDLVRTALIAGIQPALR